MTLLDQARAVVARVTARSSNGHVDTHLTSTEIIEPLFDPYLGWPDPDVGDVRPIQPIPPQHPSAPSGGGICYVPLGGATLDVLTKATTGDRDVQWLPASAASLPPGGVATDVLTKQSATDGDATWQQPMQEVWVGNTDPAAANPGIELWYDTTTTPGVLKVRVGAAWVAVVSGGEVWIGPTDPILANPTTELWYDTTARDLKARVGAAWVVTSNEVQVGPTDPYVTDPNSKVELWADSSGLSAVPPTSVVIRVRANGQWWTGSEVFVGPGIALTARIAASPGTELWYDITDPNNHVLKARVNDVWEPIVAGSEVAIGGNDPFLADPQSATELWLDVGPTPPVLKARFQGQWRPVTPGGIVPELSYGLPPNPGRSDTFSRGDHTHGTPVAVTGVAPSDTVTEELTYDLPSAPGTSPLLSRGDHAHGTPRSEVAIGDTEPTTPKDVWIDSSQAPPIANAYINGAYVPLGIAAETAPNEVEIGNVDPRDQAVELWYDTSTIPGSLMARVNGAWVPVVRAGAPPAQIDYGTVVPAKEYDLAPSSGQSPAVSHSDHEHGTPRSEVAIGDTEPSTPKDLWVNTAATPHVLMAYVGGVYVEVGAAGEEPPNEVQIGGPDPTVRFPEAELWYDTSAVPPVLKARVNDQWVDVTAASVSEVEIAPTDPYTTDPLSQAELWFDTAANVRALKVRENGAWVLASPSFGTVYPQLSFGMQSNPGVSADASRADHSHGTPSLTDGASEVEITPDDPTATNATAELWVDTDEDFVPTPAEDEVYVGIDDPQAAGGAQDLWFNTSVTPPLLMAWDGAQWVEASTAPSEMEIGPTDPYTVDPASLAEMWFDTTGLTATPPTIGILRARHNGAWVPATGAGLIWRGQWNASTVYAQGDAVSYDQPSGPIMGTPTPVNAGVSSWECLAQTNIGASPPPLDSNRWRLIVEAGDQGNEGEPGLPGLNWIGTWDPAGTYALNDAVNYDVPLGLAPGVSSYRCTDPVTVPGMSPDTDTSHWELIAEAGQQGPEGEMGAATIIVGDFGQSKTPADLPPDGLIPASWDAAGNPLADYQMVLGQSLFYAPLAGSTDPLDGHMFQYVSVNADPSGWLDIGDIKGQPGDPGIVWQGVWLSTQQYATNDGVYFEGSSYRCVMDVNVGGAPPTMNRNNWTMLAAGATYNGTTDLWVGPNEPPPPIPPGQETELWYDTDAVPAVPTHALRAFWQPDVQYVPGDQVLWPEDAANIYLANRETVGEEPALLALKDGMDFSDRGASPTVPQGLSAVLAAPDYADGVDIRWHSGAYDWKTNNGWLGGYMVTATNAGNLPVFALATVTDGLDHTLDLLRFSVLTNLAVPFNWDLLLTELPNVMTRPWFRATAEVATNTLRVYDSQNGVDWTEIGTAVVSPDPLLTAGVTAIHIGHDNDEPTHNWGGPQSEVETFNFAGVRQTSWTAFTQPSNPDGPNYPDPPPATAPAAGIGVSPLTGEDYQIVGAVGTVWLTGRYPAWKAVTSFVQWLPEDAPSSAMNNEGLKFYGGQVLLGSGSALHLRRKNADGTWAGDTHLTQMGYHLITNPQANQGNRLYVDMHGNANGIDMPVFESRTSDAKYCFRIQAVKSGYNVRNEAKFKTWHSVGNYSENWAMMTTVASPPGLDVQGTVSLADALVRSAVATKTDIADLDPAAPGRIIDALKPITYTRVFETPPPPEDGEPVRPSPAFRQVGFTAEDIQAAAGPLSDRLVRHVNYDSATDQPTDPNEAAYSISGLLTLALAEIKSLRARVAQLEAQPK